VVSTNNVGDMTNSGLRLHTINHMKIATHLQDVRYDDCRLKKDIYCPNVMSIPYFAAINDFA
jgi:hypothetical protein